VHHHVEVDDLAVDVEVGDAADERRRLQDVGPLGVVRSAADQQRTVEIQKPGTDVMMIFKICSPKNLDLYGIEWSFFKRMKKITALLTKKMKCSFSSENLILKICLHYQALQGRRCCKCSDREIGSTIFQQQKTTKTLSHDIARHQLETILTVSLDRVLQCACVLIDLLPCTLSGVEAALLGRGLRIEGPVGAPQLVLEVVAELERQLLVAVRAHGQRGRLVTVEDLDAVEGAVREAALPAHGDRADLVAGGKLEDDRLAEDLKSS
jgi:hypothetical protein